MKTRHARALVAALCLLLLASHAADAKDTWTGVRSKNFYLVGNASEKEIRQVATRLEQFRDVFTRLFTKASFNSPIPTTVIVFKNDDAYRPFKPVVDGKVNKVAGYFLPGEDVNYITLTPASNGSDDPYRVIYHEYVHQLVDNNMGRGSAPPWFNEGLAEYYSTFEVSEDRKVHLGKFVENHLYLLRERKFIPLKELFEVNDYSLDRNKQEAKWLFYAESWALVHYLILGNDGKRLPQMNVFLDLFARHVPTEQAVAEAFQTDAAGLEKELHKYIEGHVFQEKVATFERKLEFDSEMQAAPLTEAEAERYLGDLLLHMGRYDEADARLAHALQLDPQLAGAHASLGMLRTRQRRFDEAKEQLREAVSAGAPNYLAHYYYAYALSREGMNEGGFVQGYSAETARAMRESLRKAIELRPDFPESYSLLAFVDLVAGGDLEEGVKLVERARALSPGKEYYALLLAQLYLRQEKFDAARATLEPLTRDASDPQMRANAQSFMNSVRAMQEQAERFKAAREAYEKGGGGGESGAQPPRLVRREASGEGAQEEEAKPNEESAADAMTNALNDALRKPLEGETRALGVLARIECGPKGLVFVVKSGERLLRLASKGFEGVQITAYTPEAGSELSCGPRKQESPVVVTFRPAADARAKTDGALAALEFVPSNFKLKQ
jgi:tetratricopeptide (TPR) repeat protein